MQFLKELIPLIGVWWAGLTDWGRVTHICVSKLTIIGSDNGLSPGRRQAIIFTNAGLLLIGPLGTNFSEILIGIQIFSLKKMHLKMLSGKWHLFCLDLNVLNVLLHCLWLQCDMVTLLDAFKYTSTLTLSCMTWQVLLLIPSNQWLCTTLQYLSVWEQWSCRSLALSHQNVHLHYLRHTKWQYVFCFRCLQMFIYTAFDMQRDMMITPRRLEFAQEKESELYASLMDIAVKKQDEIRRMIAETISDMRMDLLNKASDYKFRGEAQNIVLTLLMLETEYSGFGGEYHACWCSGS